MKISKCYFESEKRKLYKFIAPTTLWDYVSMGYKFIFINNAVYRSCLFFNAEKHVIHVIVQLILFHHILTTPPPPPWIWFSVPLNTRILIFLSAVLEKVCLSLENGIFFTSSNTLSHSFFLSHTHARTHTRIYLLSLFLSYYAVSKET